MKVADRTNMLLITAVAYLAAGCRGGGPNSKLGATKPLLVEAAIASASVKNVAFELKAQISVPQVRGIPILFDIRLTNIGYDAVEIIDNDFHDHLAILLTLKNEDGTEVPTTSFGASLFSHGSSVFTPMTVLQPKQSLSWHIDLAKCFSIVPQRTYIVQSMYHAGSLEFGLSLLKGLVS